jgi:hypothetical protein
VRESLKNVGKRRGVVCHASQFARVGELQRVASLKGLLRGSIGAQHAPRRIAHRKADTEQVQSFRASRPQAANLGGTGSVEGMNQRPGVAALSARKSFATILRIEATAGLLDCATYRTALIIQNARHATSWRSR